MNLKQNIINLLKPKDELDKLIVWTVTDINDKLFLNNHKSEIRIALKELEKEGIAENPCKQHPKWRLLEKDDALHESKDDNVKGVKK